MSWGSYKPASAVATIWSWFPLAAWEAFAAGAVHLSASPSTLIQLERHKFFRICSYEKCARNSLAICTYKSLDLNLFGINTYKKIGGWVGAPRLAPSAQPAWCPECPLWCSRARFPGCTAEQFHREGDPMPGSFNRNPVPCGSPQKVLVGEVRASELQAPPGRAMYNACGRSQVSQTFNRRRR